MRNTRKVTASVFVAVLNPAGEVLLMRRKNTGYMDGYYNFPSGHVETGERLDQAAARELEEEAKVETNPKELEVFHIYVDEVEPTNPYQGTLFLYRGYTGDFGLGEPDKSDDIGFFALDNLPKMTPITSEAIKSLDTSVVTHALHT